MGSLTTHIVIFFLGAALFLYCLLGGADFGAGVLQIFVGPRLREKYEGIVRNAMGPVWEANHMWLIIVVVILFNGFPKIYAELSIYFHIPLTAMLIGIILRGCTFSFRHYDAIKDKTTKYYSIIFSISSIITPVMLGTIIGALMLGRVDPGANTYYAKFVGPWLNVFSMSVGIFVLCLFTFLSSVFLIGETDDGELKAYFSRKAKLTNLLTVISGGIVFGVAQLNGLSLLQFYFRQPVTFVAIIGATVSLFLLWKYLDVRIVWRTRWVAGFQLLMIMAAWFAIIYPNVIFYADGTALSLFSAAAPQATLRILATALMIGSVVFAPALYYLFVVFKGSQ